jgi:hypothetical protein
VPEIVDYELRRELIRLGKVQAISDLQTFETDVPGRYLPVNTPVLRHAAELWAEARKQGIPTAHEHELDVDVILAAQALGVGLPPTDFAVATGNPLHLSRFVPADLWQNI